MSKNAFHIYNFIILLLLLSFLALALFGAGMSAGGIGAETGFAAVSSVVLWGIFYFIPFIRLSKAWRISWFLIMLIFLGFWITGLGVQVSLMIV